MPKRRAWTLWVGLAVIAACEALLFIDVQRRGGLVVGRDVFASDLPRPTETLGWVARWFAVNMTALAWVGYLLAVDGLLALLSRWRNRPEIASIPARPNRFIVAWLTSIPVWCVFDAINFYWMDAWRYHGLPPLFGQRVLGYFIAFAAITPGMLLAGQAYLAAFTAHRPAAAPSRGSGSRLGWFLVLVPWAIIATISLALMATHDDPRLNDPVAIIGSALLLLGPPIGAMARRQSLLTVSFAVGVGFTVWTLWTRDPIANLTLWTGLIYLLDPINAAAHGTPSLLRDWQAGRAGRTAALFVGGLTCGLLWEFWNYWAIAKWTYHLPFLGRLESVRYFEMPVFGMLGFLPFAAECWVMLNTIVLALEKLGLRIAEPLPDAKSIL